MKDAKYQIGDHLTEDDDDRTRITITRIDTSTNPTRYIVLEEFDGEFFENQYAEDALDHGFTLISNGGDHAK